VRYSYRSRSRGRSGLIRVLAFLIMLAAIAENVYHPQQRPVGSGRSPADYHAGWAPPRSRAGRTAPRRRTEAMARAKFHRPCEFRKAFGPPVEPPRGKARPVARIIFLYKLGRRVVMLLERSSWICPTGPASCPARRRQRLNETRPRPVLARSALDLDPEEWRGQAFSPRPTPISTPEAAQTAIDRHPPPRARQPGGAPRIRLPPRYRAEYEEAAAVYRRPSTAPNYTHLYVSLGLALCAAATSTTPSPVPRASVIDP